VQTIIEKIRDIIGDNSTKAIDVFEYLTSDIFTLSEANPIESSLSVLVNGNLHNGSGKWSFDSSSNKITVDDLSVSDIVEIDYNTYLKYSDEEIKQYIRAALVYISTEKYKDFKNQSDYIFPTPIEKEENLIALVASILIKPPVKSYRTPEFSISFEEPLSKEQKIKRLVKQYKSYLGTIDYVDLAANIEVEDEE